MPARKEILEAAGREVTVSNPDKVPSTRKLSKAIVELASRRTTRSKVNYWVIEAEALYGIAETIGTTPEAIDEALVTDTKRATN